MDISVFGLGKLGSVIATLFASKGHNVIGVDLNQKIINKLNEKISPYDEPFLQDLLYLTGKNLNCTIDFQSAVLNSEVSFIIVPTPSELDGSFSNQNLNDVLNNIGSVIAEKKDFHLVIVNSTVMPTSSKLSFIETLEKKSGKKLGRDFGLVYSPEFIALGNIVENMENPDLILIGESDSMSGDMALKLYKSIIKNNPTIHRMSLTNAEIVKIAINTFVTTKISFANMLSELCDYIPDTDIDVITKAVGSDSRIGQKYLKAATGYGGPCFPRDNIALTSFAKKLNVDFYISSGTDSINRRQVNRIKNIISVIKPNAKKVGVLGLSYKPDTPVIEESQGILLSQLLSESGFFVYAHDPIALNYFDHPKDKNIVFTKDLNLVLNNVEIVVIMTPWEIYREINPIFCKNKVIIDCWRILSKNKFKDSHIKYLGNSILV